MAIKQIPIRLNARPTLCNVPRRNLWIQILRRGMFPSVCLALCLMGVSFFLPLPWTFYHELIEYHQKKTTRKKTTAIDSFLEIGAVWIRRLFLPTNNEEKEGPFVSSIQKGEPIGAAVSGCHGIHGQRKISYRLVFQRLLGNVTSSSGKITSFHS